MIFNSPDFLTGIPRINTLNIVVVPDFKTGLPSAFTGYSAVIQSLITGIPQPPGTAISIYPFINRLTYFQAIWGLDATQNINEVVIKKSNLPSLTPKNINSPTAVLLAIINNLIVNFPTSASIPIHAYIFSAYPDGDYEYIDIVIRISKILNIVNFEIQYPNSPYDPDLFTM